ncbi:hypothetical protein FSP39_017076 [Pinctada imbricata]|uniref:Uncharacterized protein n=1 Tax=Pinctada imbricata TaxID=66713 RepID=A0AA89CA51_PINIB|nr:hypothetical protein FSP39_017076 [Pinctada imbricata]
MVVVLKKRHSLHGKNLLPLIMRFKEADIEDIEVDSLARLKEEHRLERYTIEELEGEFYSLCGEKVEDFYQLAGKSRSKESAMVLLNMAIHLANEIGAPRGTPLQPLTPNSATTSNRKSATVTAAAGSPDQQQPVVNMTKKDSQPEDRISAVEKAIQDLKKDKGSQVEEALRQINVLAGRPKLTSPAVIIAAVESLVDVATRTSDKNLEYY